MREGILPLNSHTWAGILSTTHEKVTKGPLAPPQLDPFLSTAKEMEDSAIPGSRPE
jgi:hypothetical protein